MAPAKRVRSKKTSQEKDFVVVTRSKCSCKVHYPPKTTALLNVGDSISVEEPKSLPKLKTLRVMIERLDTSKYWRNIQNWRIRRMWKSHHQEKRHTMKVDNKILDWNWNFRKVPHRKKMNHSIILEKWLRDFCFGNDDLILKSIKTHTVQKCRKNGSH